MRVVSASRSGIALNAVQNLLKSEALQLSVIRSYISREIGITLKPSFIIEIQVLVHGVRARLFVLQWGVIVYCSMQRRIKSYAKKLQLQHDRDLYSEQILGERIALRLAKT